jgi:hypothetical protein
MANSSKHVFVQRIPVVDLESSRPNRELQAHATIRRRSLKQQEQDLLRATSAGIKPEPDLFNILILNYTMKCPLACDYCCYHCSPKRQETMDVELALDLVDQAAELGVFAQCGFTGGEALIFYDDVMRITERMQRRNLPFSMISSCYWAKTPQDARRVLGDLKAHGIDVFTATHDPSHENWVPIQYVRHAIDAALEHGVHVCLCSSFYDDTKRLEQIFPEYAGHPDIDIVNRIVLPDVGRASRRRIVKESYTNVDPMIGMGACYKRIYHDVTVFWDGEVYPCCSVYNRDTPALSLGNAYRQSLSELWDRVQGSLLLRTMKRDGFDELFRVLSHLDPELADGLPNPAKAVGACHLCHLTFRDPALAGRIHRAMEIHEREVIRTMLAEIVQSHGAKTAQRIITSTLENGD